MLTRVAGIFHLFFPVCAQNPKIPATGRNTGRPAAPGPQRPGFSAFSREFQDAAVTCAAARAPRFARSI
jgi:hypothetical protein